jgi:hypothetical protein
MRHLPIIVVAASLPFITLGSCSAPAVEEDNARGEPPESLSCPLSGPEAEQAPVESEKSQVIQLVAERRPAAGAVPAPAGGACPDAMILVEGAFCPTPDQPCLNWMDDPVKYPYARCAEFAQPSTCKGERVRLRFCIDRHEAAEATGMPIADTSWTNASAACKAQGKRLCQEREWLFACEGEEMRPYPYGYVRNPALCNFEKDNLVVKGELADQRQPVTANPECLSPFGVQNMVGNIDEWVVLDKPHYSGANGGRKMVSGLKGGWWGPLRNRCRPTTVDHDEYFHELQTGYRCCADARAAGG